MSEKERRISPRKECTVPLRFRVVTNGHGEQAEDIAAAYRLRRSKDPAHVAALEGEALNVSEHGVYFTSRENLHVGEALEMRFTLPWELTGRSPELVRCRARVVHVDENADPQGDGGTLRAPGRGAQLGQLTAPASKAYLLPAARGCTVNAVFAVVVLLKSSATCTASVCSPGGSPGSSR